MKKEFPLKALFLLFFLIPAFTLQTTGRSLPNVSTFAQWVILGNLKADHSADHQSIDLGGRSDYYRSIKIKVTNSPLNMTKLVVVYGDGGAPENIEMRQDIPKDGESREIDLKGGKRKIRSIQFWFDTKGFLNGKANVTVFGRK